MKFHYSVAQQRKNSGTRVISSKEGRGGTSEGRRVFIQNSLEAQEKNALASKCAKWAF